MKTHRTEVTWCKADHGWGVGVSPNDLFRKHISKVWRHKRVMEIIVEKCRKIWDSLSWDLPWMELSFSANGPGVQVEGVNGCYCVPDGNGGYIEHNIDTADQAFCIFFCLRTAIDEIEIALEYWEEQEQAGKEIELDEEPKETIYIRFEKDNVPWTLFETQFTHFDEPQLDFKQYIWAKGPHKAKEIAEHQLTLIRSIVLVNELKAGPARILAELKTTK